MSRKFPRAAGVTEPCTVCGRPYGEHAGQKCPKPSPPATGPADPLCLCGHRASDHQRRGKFAGLCAECSCELYEAAPAARELGPERGTLPGQLGMLGVGGRQADGRAGKVFSLRLLPSERKRLEDARAKEAERARKAGRWIYGGTPLGLWIRKAALERADRVLEAGTTGASSRRKKAAGARR